MGRIDELVSAEFAAWEQRGRGWRLWPHPVQPEPAFIEFEGYRLDLDPLPSDDGQSPGWLSSLFARRERPPPPLPAAVHDAAEPRACRETLSHEFLLALPERWEGDAAAMCAWLDSLHGCREPVAFELVATEETVRGLFAAAPSDAAFVRRQLTAYLPDLPCIETEDTLRAAWEQNEGVGFVVDFGLAHEFMLPLATEHALDPLIGLVAALGELKTSEVGVFQVVFQPVRQSWDSSVWRSVTDAHGKALFVNRIPLVPGTKTKLEAPLFGVVIRAAARAPTFERAASILGGVAGALRPFSRPEGNALIPLHNEDYPYGDHERGLCNRQSYRSGMILNREELLGFAHPPSDAVRSPRLARARLRSHAAPASAPSGLFLGLNVHAGRSTPVYLSPEQRVRHVHILGGSGTGKSTLLFNLIQGMIGAGEGLAVFDPHGDLIDRVLENIPEERASDVIVLNPADTDAPVAFNVLSAHSDQEKNLLASDLVSVFQRLSTSWGDQMGSVLQNAILAFLESSRGGTLADLRLFLVDARFREDFLQTVRDPDHVFYWRRVFPQLPGGRSLGSVLTRLETFLTPKPIRALVSQPVNRLDFTRLMDSGAIVLARLSQGELGRENAHLLGSLLMAKFQQAAMSRQTQAEGSRRLFTLVVDEFHHFITPSLAEMLTGVRKYRVSLVLAHQDLRQLERDREVGGAVLSGSGTRIVFRVGDDDARKLSEGFAHFEPSDLQNLKTGEALGRIEQRDRDFNLSVPPPCYSGDRARRERILTRSREKHGTPKAEVEAWLARRLEALQASTTKAKEPKPGREAVPKPSATGAPAEVPKKPVAAKSPASIPSVAPAVEAEPVAAPKPEPVPVQPSKEVPVVTTPALEVTRPQVPPGGIGGNQHNLIRERIEKAARALGYTAAREHRLAGRGQVDVVLEKPGRAIAVEIAVTTTIDHEVGNVAKCLQAGFPQVALVSPRPERLGQIRAAVQASLPPEQAARVSFHSPEELLSWLKQRAEQEAALAPSEASVQRGKYRVTRQHATLTPEERRQREAQCLQTITGLMQRKG